MQPKAYLLSLISCALAITLFVMFIMIWSALNAINPVYATIHDGQLTQMQPNRVTIQITDSYTTYLPLVSRPLIVIPADNGGFENGPVQWDEFSTVKQRLIRAMPDLGVPPHSGSWAATLGNYDDEISIVSTGVTIDKDVACLVYWQWVQSDDACQADYGGVGVNGKWRDVRSLCAGTSTARWVQQSITMTRYTTTTIVLNFAVTNDYSVPSKMYIDDISFQSTSRCADVGPSATHQSFPIDELLGQPIIAEKDRNHASILGSVIN